MLIVVHETLFQLPVSSACVRARVLKRRQAEWSHMTAGHTQSAVARIRHLKGGGRVALRRSILTPSTRRSHPASFSSSAAAAAAAARMHALTHIHTHTQPLLPPGVWLNGLC